MARLSQTDARASAVFVDELDAGGFQSWAVDRTGRQVQVYRRRAAALKLPAPV
jgi:hypothetical protein